MLTLEIFVCKNPKMRSLSNITDTDFSIRNLDIPMLHTSHKLFCDRRPRSQAFSSQLNAHALILRGSMAERQDFPSIRASPANLHKPKLNLLPSLSPYHVLCLVWPQLEGLFPKFCLTNVFIWPYNWEWEWMDLSFKWEITPSCLKRKSFISHMCVDMCAHVLAHACNRPNFAYLLPKQTNIRQQVVPSTLCDVYKTHHSVLFSLAFLKVRALE